MWFYEYKVSYLDPCGSDIVKDSGLVSAKCYEDALRIVINGYGGESDIVDIYIASWDNKDYISLYDIKDGFKLT